jgi:hypothetical protein
MLEPPARENRISFFYTWNKPNIMVEMLKNSVEKDIIGSMRVNSNILQLTIQV